MSPFKHSHLLTTKMPVETAVAIISVHFAHKIEDPAWSDDPRFNQDMRGKKGNDYRNNLRLAALCIAQLSEPEQETTLNQCAQNAQEISEN